MNSLTNIFQQHPRIIFPSLTLLLHILNHLLRNINKLLTTLLIILHLLLRYSQQRQTHLAINHLNTTLKKLKQKVKFAGR